MRIERVDDKTVKCFLSNEELQEYDIDYKDFVLRSEKAREVVQDIIAHAAQEVGYKPPRFAFDLQIMMLPEQGMLLTFSEKEPFDLENNAQLLQCLKEMKEIIQRARGLGIGEGTSGEGKQETASAETDGLSHGKNIGDAANGHSDSQKGSAHQQSSAPQQSSGGKQPGRAMQQSSRPDFAVFSFESLRSVMELAGALPGNLRVQSALYEMNDLYYLHLHKGGASYERYSRACIQAMEFGSLYTAEKDKLLHLEEHGRCLIAEKALKKLRLN